MRFIKWFLSFLIFLVVVGGGSVFLLREGLLFWAHSEITQDIAFLQRTNTWADMATKCLEESGSPANRLQLRFLDDRQYVLEIACEGSFQYFPWSEVRTLPWQVKKTTGSAGFVVPIDGRTLEGEVTLSLWLRNILIQSESGQVKVRSGKSTLLTDSMVSSCVAHGLTCCDPVSEMGVGELFSRGVNDCQENCFTACEARPNLLFFQTDPPADLSTRVVQLTKGNTFMLFNFTFATPQTAIQKIVLDFGDGTQEEFTTAIGKTTHEYNCLEDSCHYVASIRAVDQNGISSADLRINQIQIVVQ